MKKNFVLLCFLLTYSIGMLHAQTEKGRLYVGATTGDFSFQSTKQDKNFGISLAPAVGVFVANNLVVGGQLPMYLRTSNSIYGGKYSYSGIGIGAFSRYYIPLTERLKLPIQATARYSIGHSSSSVSTSTGTSLTFELMGGVSYFLNDHASLDLLVGYRGFNPLTPSSTSSPYQGSLAGGLGFSLYLDHK